MDKNHLYELVKLALREDDSWGDITSESLIEPGSNCELEILLKEEGIIAGLEVAEQAFRMVTPNLEWTPYHKDGEFLEPGSIIANVSGNAQSLLIAERVALNFLQHLSGIATLTGKYIKEIRKKSENAKLVDTRKTTPGLRVLEKYAVRMGGARNHRFNLSDAVLIKDNHLAILNQNKISLKKAIATAKKRVPHTMKIEVEVSSLSEIPEVLEAGAEIVLLDNMSCEELKKAVGIIGNRAITEASGGIQLDNVGQVAATGVDIISVGAITHSAPNLDISLNYKN